MALRELITLVERHTANTEYDGSDAPKAPLVPGLHLFRATRPTEFHATVYHPTVCIILQGQKQTSVGDRDFRPKAGEFFVVSHELPVVARIAAASRGRPYLSLVASLDLAELRSLHDQVDSPSAPDVSSSYAIAPIDDALLDVMTRYLALADEPAALPVLAPLIRRELHFRLLVADNGAMLRRLVHHDSHASKIGRAIAQLRSSYRDRLEVPLLARDVGMSTSSFHKHFKQVTSTTPLQYQKDLRLTEAQRLLRVGTHNVSSVAFEVGYESPTQFSREYSRKFGQPPSAELPA